MSRDRAAEPGCIKYRKLSELRLRTSDFLLFPIFESMQSVNVSGIQVENKVIISEYLQREVKVDFFLPKNVTDPSSMSLLLINDGQDMEVLGLEAILSQLYLENAI